MEDSAKKRREERGEKREEERGGGGEAPSFSALAAMVMSEPSNRSYNERQK